MRLPRTPLLAALGLVGLGVCLASCFGHHTSDEVVLKNAAEGSGESDEEDLVVEEDGEDEPNTRADAGPRDAGRDTGAAVVCNQADLIERFLCDAGLGGSGSIDDIIGGILGGGMQTTNCARETDPIARLLCQATGTGGGGIEGIIGGLLGGGGALLTDGGIERVLTTVIVDVIDTLLNDLLTSLFGGRDAGTRTTRVDAGRGRQLVVQANTKSGDVDDLVRSDEECKQVVREDILTRLLCAQKAIAAIKAAQ
jgi:hypothetical protein